MANSAASDRAHATVYERMAWHHDIGHHANSENPYAYCPRCEMEHPLGKYQMLRAENERLRSDVLVALSVGRALCKQLNYRAGNSEWTADAIPELDRLSELEERWA